MQLDDLRPLGLFDGLSDRQLEELLASGDAIPVEPGVELFTEGQPADFWWVLVSGAIELHRRTGREDSVVGRMDVPGRWAGGFRAWDPQGRYLASGRGVTDGVVLRVPSSALADLTVAWFPFAHHLIDGVYGTARSIEATARQRESLVTLGTLAAGLAHELNNPAAAAMRAVDALEDACRTLLSSLGRLAGGEITARQFTALDQLRQQAEPQRPITDPLLIADQEDALSDWLADHGVERDWLVAPPLAAAGVDTAWCERAATILPDAALGPGLEWVASTFSAITLLSEVKESTGRVSELVSAVRSYSQMDRGSLQRIDLTDGLESTLVMLSHKLRGVEVVRQYDPAVPEIEAYAGELNQVWTNLIDNAVDAMAGEGTLRVGTTVDGDHVMIEIGDSGPGMPAEVEARAFDAFYTTKDVGKGTGLGLDIARRIVVERHGGTITIDTRPGATVLRVRLPLTPPLA
ncbi:ATP-binding protein [Microlunatus soli]|uniref:histidine kinase n=1 Tax=Microlunatus soli TaxID=630515 RepID=A0A1H1R2F5_9ACTN|nr:ATP-binding protein [Microlunatus soli]SDS29947.1 Histidine kinase-, DNA gyrase B-, and HSP90-like ATPase [Microlunatus soli]